MIMPNGKVWVVASSGDIDKAREPEVQRDRGGHEKCAEFDSSKLTRAPLQGNKALYVRLSNMSFLDLGEGSYPFIWSS